MSETAAAQSATVNWRWRPYPEYKESGIEWMEEVPSHWEVKRLKWTVKSCQNGIWGEEPRGSDDDIVCVRVADFDRVRFRVNLSRPTMRSIPLSQRKGRVLKRGDLLLEKSGGGDLQPVGTVVLYDALEPAVCSNFIARLPLADGYDSTFLCYLHAALYATGVNIVSIKQTTGIQNLDSLAYLNEPVPLPLLPEQHAISNFLDRETAKIDALVAEKERLVELLQEKRIAIISYTVTKGLDPGAPMKESGVEWLGEIPAHWQAKKLKFIISEPLQYGANEPAEIDDASLPRYIRITDINEDGSLREETFRSLPEHIAKPYLLKQGDLLFARSGATVGKTFLYRKSWGRAAYAGYLIRARIRPTQAVPGFLFYFAHSNSYWDWLSSRVIQATIQNVSAKKYATLKIGLPPVNEQRVIVATLDERTKEIDSLIAKVQQGIAKLREYRVAVISAAVIGKIDVRGEVTL